LGTLESDLREQIAQLQTYDIQVYRRGEERRGEERRGEERRGEERSRGEERRGEERRGEEITANPKGKCIKQGIEGFDRFPKKGSRGCPTKRKRAPDHDAGQK
jgi:hypothetical protein